jgi:large subunit ribosomal protein L15
MKLHELKPPDGARRERRRVGRGLGSGRGKTSGKGVKGQKARAGGGVPLYFEGGQLPLVRKLPYRRGFTNPSRIEYEVVNLDQLDALSDVSEVTPEALRAAGLIGKSRAPLKVLARGTLTKKLTVHAHRFSVAARDAIAKAGGSAVQIGGPVEAPEAAPAPESSGTRPRRRSAPAAGAAGEVVEAPAPAEEPTETAAQAEATAQAEAGAAPARRRRAPRAASSAAPAPEIAPENEESTKEQTDA